MHCIYTSCLIKAILDLYVEEKVQNLNLDPNCINSTQYQWRFAFVKADSLTRLGLSFICIIYTRLYIYIKKIIPYHDNTLSCPSSGLQLVLTEQSINLVKINYLLFCCVFSLPLDHANILTLHLSQIKWCCSLASSCTTES